MIVLQRIFGAHERKQNRKITTAVEQAHAHDNKLAHKSEQLNKYLDLHKEFGSQDIDALQSSFKKGGENYVKHGGKKAAEVQKYINYIKQKGPGELNEKLKELETSPNSERSLFKAEKQVLRGHDVALERGADEAATISKTRSSIATEKGLDINHNNKGTVNHQIDPEKGRHQSVHVENNKAGIGKGSATVSRASDRRAVKVAEAAEKAGIELTPEASRNLTNARARHKATKAILNAPNQRAAALELAKAEREEAAKHKAKESRRFKGTRKSAKPIDLGGDNISATITKNVNPKKQTRAILVEGGNTSSPKVVESVGHSVPTSTGSKNVIEKVADQTKKIVEEHKPPTPPSSTSKSIVENTGKSLEQKTGRGLGKYGKLGLGALGLGALGLGAYKYHKSKNEDKKYSCRLDDDEIALFSDVTYYSKLIRK